MTINKPTLYAELLQQAEALFKGERDPIANAANLSALIWHALPDLNWAGIYRFDGRELVLGPFQGKPACGADGVLDLDSQKFNRFDEEDRKGLEALAECWARTIS